MQSVICAKLFIKKVFNFMTSLVVKRTVAVSASLRYELLTRKAFTRHWEKNFDSKALSAGCLGILDSPVSVCC